MPSVHRIIDANANRAREALRVMEEAARFVLGDAALAAALKNLRHDLAEALALLPSGTLPANRDTPGDVGTCIKTHAELSRASVAEVAAAAGKRLSEALRAIEEYGKLLPPLPPGEGGMGRRADPGRVRGPADLPGETSQGDIAHPLTPALSQGERGFAGVIESLRYRGYELEKRLNLALASGRPGRQWRLCVLLSENLCPNGDWRTLARTVVQAGADCIQLREKNLEAGVLAERARWLVELSRPRGVSVIVNDRPDLALLSGADGVHLGQHDLRCPDVRRLAGRQLLVGVSTSRIEEARQALADGADYCGVGPMFPTTTKHKDVIVGPAYLREYLSELGERLPALAIGGVTLENVAQLVAAGVRGLAVSSAVCGAADPATVVRRLLAALGGSRA